MALAPAIKWQTRLQLDDGEDFAGLADEDWLVLTALRVDIDGVDYEIEAGLVTDGGSIPTAAQAVVGERWSRPVRKPFVWHDGGYKRKLLRITPGELEAKPFAYTQKWLDDTLFRLIEHGQNEAMRLWNDGKGPTRWQRFGAWLRRHRIWVALRALGWIAWNQDGRRTNKTTTKGPAA